MLGQVHGRSCGISIMVSSGLVSSNIFVVSKTRKLMNVIGTPMRLPLQYCISSLILVFRYMRIIC